jgi:hypothetical protein
MKNFIYSTFKITTLIVFFLMLSPKCMAQNVNYTFSVDSGCAPLAITFTNTSLLGTAFEWDFGDGSPLDTTNNTTHTFYSTGEFWVILSAYDSTGSYIGSYQEKLTVTFRELAEKPHIKSL